MVRAHVTWGPKKSLDLLPYIEKEGAITCRKTINWLLSLVRGLSTTVTHAANAPHKGDRGEIDEF